ncbi:MFS transporter [Mucilaginibacter agri]|uniref:MFS transporter n=1 Tax=Mucilaginibacter agri TaxID=2695265 RepID=A0A966DW74_9SPHI|nr:MFS transporter [Mucilaginibacter agri]NCD71169.1 MFS transporter [Mucilaginibacter agri]
MRKEVKDEEVSLRFMMPLILGTMMNPLNSTMLATSLFALCNSFKVSVGQGAILITSLYVTSTIAQPLMGRLADIFSPKKINTLGFILVLIAALIGVFAPAFSWLIASRIFLGLGTSAAYPSAMAIINKKYAAIGKPVPGRVLGIIATSAQVSMVIGPVLGGLLTQWLGWRGIFFINIPWVLVALFLSKSIPNYGAAAANPSVSLFKRLDVPGIMIFSCFLLTLLYVLMQPFAWLPLLIPTFLLAALIIWERNQQSPFIDVRLLATNPSLLLVYVRTLATTYVLYQVLYALPQWLEAVKNLSPANTGLIMLPESAMAMAMGLLVSKSTKLFRQNLWGVMAMLLCCIAWLTLNVNSTVFYIFLVTLVMGCAEGINIIANQALLNEEAPLAQKGVSFGLSRTFGYLGAIISGSQIKVLFHNGVTDHNFHIIGYTVMYSCVALMILLIPLWFRMRKTENLKGAV